MIQALADAAIAFWPITTLGLIGLAAYVIEQLAKRKPYSGIGKA